MRRTYISRVEQGHTIPSLETLQRFASALDVPMYRLFYRAQHETTLVAAAVEALAQGTGTESTDARFLLQLKPLLDKIAESDRAFLLDCARKLVAHEKARVRSESGRFTKLAKRSKAGLLIGPHTKKRPQ